MSDDTDIVSELRAYEQAHRLQAGPSAGVSRPDHEAMAGRYKRAADEIETLRAERDEALARVAFAAAIISGDAVWDKHERLEQAERERDDLKREMHARELHHFEEEQKSAGLAAVVEKVRFAVNDPKYGRDAEWVAMNVRGALSTAPADALREHDRVVAERAWDEAIRHQQKYVGVGNRSPHNPYRKEQENGDPR